MSKAKTVIDNYYKNVYESKFSIVKTSLGKNATFDYKDDTELKTILKEIAKKHKFDDDSVIIKKGASGKNSAIVPLNENVATDSIKALIDTNFSASDDEKGKAASLLRGLFFSDEPEAVEFVKKLDGMLSNMKLEERALFLDGLNEKRDDYLQKASDLLIPAQDAAMKLRTKLWAISNSNTKEFKALKPKIEKAYKAIEDVLKELDKSVVWDWDV
jgi:hypothetical protein